MSPGSLRSISFCCLCAFVAGCAPPAPPELWKEFSGDRALEEIRQVVEFGVRPPGSEALEKCRQHLEARLAEQGWSVERRSFERDTPVGKITFVNLLARYGGAAAHRKEPRWLVCAHYDTKIFRDFAFVGANDAGSGTGALVELSRVLSRHPALARQVELVFFDGEEAIVDYTGIDGLYGSRRYALELRNRAHRPVAGILWDMIADRDLRITLPADSPPRLARLVFESAEALGVRGAFTLSRQSILDDHVPLNGAGVPTIDLIDFEYPPWHTRADTMDQLSASSLETVGRVTLRMLLELSRDGE